MNKRMNAVGLYSISQAQRDLSGVISCNSLCTWRRRENA